MTFPVSPNRGDTHTTDDTVFVYNGVDWDRSVIGSNNSSDYSSNSLFDRIAALEGLPFLIGYATEAYVGTQVADLIDAAPGTLDTLNELAAAIGDDSNYATTIANSIATVQADVDQNESDADVAIAALQADVDANETAAAALVTTLETARNVITAAISARVTTLEADPTTAAALAVVQADVDANETDADSALATLTTNLSNEGAARLLSDNALGVRVTTLEADPTTATAVAAVQADVDANEVTAANAVTAAAGVAAAATAAQNTTMLAAVAVVQADVDQNETDADAAIAVVQADVDQNESDCDAANALKFDKTGGTVTGDLLLKNPDGSAVSLKLSRADHPDMSCEWKVTPSYVSSSKECLSILAAGQPVAHFDERQRVSINKTDPDYTLDVAGDGKFSTGLTVGGLTDAANDSAAATAGVAVNQLYRNGSVVMIRVS